MTFLILLFAFTGVTLAVARLTKLMTTDEITDFIRIRIYTRWGEHSMPGYLSRCPWCQSIWYGFASAWAVILPSGISWWWYPVIVGAISELVGLISEHMHPEDDAEVIEIK